MIAACRSLVALLIVFWAGTATAQNPRIVEWVEDAPLSDNSKIALGYPVPMPVDTPLPFAGFRSYAGLHMRHQDLAATTPWVHPVELGRTVNNRALWLYQLGDADRETKMGLPEHAMLTNAGIHAREWQSPEVATGIIEFLALAEDENHLVSYLRDNANVLLIPVLNVDGFLQTQRSPSRNWLDTDPDYPQTSPRDGRMRRKNMRGPDENLETRSDHLLGVDLNRNNPPFFATNPDRSSANRTSLVHHGASEHSEPETQALVAAVEHGPVEMLSMYTDMHSFSQVHFWGRNNNQRLARLTDRLLETFSEHHRSFPAGKNYVFQPWTSVPWDSGIGTTDELFTHIYQVPSWTLEIEPSNGASYHSPLPGQGADYGGLARNGHDGFILPESEVERVRTELAQTFAVAYYQQAGPPSITALRLIDAATRAVVFEAEWDVVSPVERQLHSYQPQALQLGRDYLAWISWDKPMRWREGGSVTTLPGQAADKLDLGRAMTAGGRAVSAALGEVTWLDSPGDAPDGYRFYRDDSAVFSLELIADEANLELIGGNSSAVLEIDAHDLSGSRSDADPATVARWESGAWAGYEDSAGQDDNDSGGVDSTIEFEITTETLDDPYLVEPASSAMWYDVSRNGEGFMLEVIASNRAILYWFTYDTDGRQDWYFGDGEIRGNRVIFTDILRVAGGEFGPGFDPEKVTRTAVGSASFTWSDCSSGVMNWVMDRDGGARRSGRMNVSRLTQVMGFPCAGGPEPPLTAEMNLSGSWYDPNRSGEGLTIEVLSNQQVLAFFFSYDTHGARRWFFGTGEFEEGKIVFPEMFTTQGGIFGAGFDPEAVEVNDWGTMELDLECKGGVARFTPTETGFARGELSLSRLTLLDGLDCGD